MSQDYTAAYIIKKVNITNDEDIKMLKDASLDTVYDCSNNTRSAGFTLLMKLILLERYYASKSSIINIMRGESLCYIIKKYIALHPEEVSKVNDKNWTPLMLTISTAKTCNIEIIKLLLKYTSNVNAMNNRNCTALVLSAIYNPKNCATVVKILLKHGADIDIANIKGWTALMIAIENKSAYVIQLLLEHNANVNIVNNDGCNALTLACEFLNRTYIIKLLLDHNANVNIVNNDGYNALTYAIINKNTYVIKLLLEHGANTNVINKNKNIALITALNNSFAGDYDCLKLLFEYDAYLIPFSIRRNLLEDSKECDQELRKVYNNVTILNIKN